MHFIVTSQPWPAFNINCTPDTADSERIKISEAQLIESNNRRVLINTEPQRQINKLTDTINKIIGQNGNISDTPKFTI